MPAYQLDASALLAVMLNERGHERVRAIIDQSAIHAANLAEVVGKLMREGVPAEEVRQSVEELNLEPTEEFGLAEAIACGTLLAKTRTQGLSLGDCICLTAAAWKRRAAVTAERRWKDLEGTTLAGTRLEVELIR